MTATTFNPSIRREQGTVRLTTFRRDGTAVGTAVHVVAEGDRAFFRLLR
jgi:hypothetical protein